MLEVVGSRPALPQQRIKFLGLLSLPAGVGLETVSGVTGCACRQSGAAAGVTPFRRRDIKLPTRLHEILIHSPDGFLLYAHLFPTSCIHHLTCPLRPNRNSANHEYGSNYSVDGDNSLGRPCAVDLQWPTRCDCGLYNLAALQTS